MLRDAGDKMTNFERHDEHHEGIPVNEVVLIELRELRTDFNKTMRETGERLASLEAQLHAVLGNGQPGRLTLVEQSCKELSAFRWKAIGYCTATATVASTVAAFLLHLI
jgi:hypothetical protein